MTPTTVRAVWPFFLCGFSYANCLPRVFCSACLIELPSFIPEDFPGEISLLPKGGGGLRSILQRPVGLSLTNDLDDISKGRDFKKTLLGTAKLCQCPVILFACACL
jgi:hypothetical protein